MNHLDNRKFEWENHIFRFIHMFIDSLNVENISFSNNEKMYEIIL